jgi:zinc protease
MTSVSRSALFAGLCLSLAACAHLGGTTPRHAVATTPAAPAPTPVVVAVATPAPAPAARPSAPGWPQAYADLPPDPAMRFGTLPNGMRYVVMHNATPGGQASLRLRINAGSIDETADEAGLAHFLEHMAFNGSLNVPRGEMIKTLQRHGLAFGADTNASTSWEDTIYKLDLPQADAETIDVSLKLLREIGGRLSLTQDAIDHEKGVVLSEERLRDTPGYRVTKQSIGLQLQGQLAASRFPIGQVAVIQNATHAQLQSFYDRYYRPERAVLIAVGDFDPDAMEARIKGQFGDWSGVGQAGKSPDLGTPIKRGAQVRLFVQPGAQQSVQLSWVAPAERALDSVAKRRRDTIEALGLAALNRRLDRMVRSPEPPFITAEVYRANLFHSAHVTTVKATTRPGAWRAALAAIDQETRRMAQYGVSGAELDQEIAAMRAGLKAEADGEATRTTPSVADDIIETLAAPEVETSPEEDLALFEDAVKDLTPDTVNLALKAAFAGSGPLVAVASPTAIEGGDKALDAALSKTEATPVSAPDPRLAAVWPYANFGVTGHIAERTEAADIDTTFVRFANGVRLTVKPTKFRTDQILVKVRIGDGQLGLPTDKATTAWAAATAFPEGGLDKLSAEDIDDVMNARIVGRQFAVDEDAFVLQGATRPDDLDAQLQLLAAYVAHPGWRPQAFERMKGAAPSVLDQLGATPNGVVNRDLGMLLHSGDPRFGLPSRADIAAQTPADLRALLESRLSGASLEVVIVGDITPDKAIEAVAATFAALPPRAAPSAGPLAYASFPASTPTPVMRTHSGRADQAVGFVAWPTDDFLSDTQKARILLVLSDILEDRLIDKLRMKEGVTYTPQSGTRASQAFPHYGYLSASIEAPPAKLEGFFADVSQITADLRANPPSADELKRAKTPEFEALEKRRQTNEYWLAALSAAQTDPRRLAAIRSSEAQLQHVSAEDVRRAAAAYLVDDKAWKLEVTPARRSTPSDTQGK